MTSPSGPLSYAQLMGLWQTAALQLNASSTVGAARIAAAVALAESAGDPGAIQQDQPYVTTGWGLWQITPGNSVPQVATDAELLNPWYNAFAAVTKWTQAGGSFEPWTTFTSGKYLQFYEAATQPLIPPAVPDEEWTPSGEAPAGTAAGTIGPVLTTTMWAPNALEEEDMADPFLVEANSASTADLPDGEPVKAGYVGLVIGSTLIRVVNQTDVTALTARFGAPLSVSGEFVVNIANRTSGGT